MKVLRSFANRFPVAAFVLGCFLFSWSIWLSIPTLAGENWILIKILVGVGIGPGLTAVLLDRIRHGWNERDFKTRWWVAFCCVALPVVALDIWSLLGGDGLGNSESPPGLGIVGLGGALVSGAMAGFVFATARGSSSRVLSSIAQWRVRPVWLLLALFFPALLLGSGLGISVILGSELPAFPLAGTSWTEWLPYVARSFLFSLLIVTVGEEPGWRGYLLPELQLRFSPLTASLILGVIWGLWHLPIYFIGFYDFPGDPLANALMFTVFATVFGFVFTWMFNRTGGILSLALLLHAAHNTTTKIIPSSTWYMVALLVLVVFLIFHGQMWKKIRQHE